MQCCVLCKGKLKIVSEHDKSFLRKIKPFIKISKNSKILEIGCGNGSLLEEFRSFKIN